MAYKYIKAKPISYGNERPYSAIKYIAIHYTGNDSRKDTATAECLFFARYGDGNTRNAGAHFFVGQDGEVVKSIAMNLTAWAVGGFETNANGAASLYGKCTNSNSVSIELCDNATRDPSPAQIAAVKELIKYIRRSCPNAKTLVRHYDCSGKKCPARMIDAKKWENFKRQVDPQSETTVVKKATAYPTKDLKYADTGEQVKRLQKCLNKIDGAGLTVDGSYGNATLKAVRTFKVKHMGAKKPTDKVGTKTRAKIKALIEAKK